jgi:TonB-linked SusC/RagA family outer membrane protein
MKNFTLLSLLLLLFALPAMAQKTVTGTVIGEDGEGLIGVNVIETGTTNGMITDIDGKYSITVADNASIEFSMIGYSTSIVKVGNQTTINVTLDEGVALDEMVVTALGIERSKKSLGYSVTEVSGEDFTEAREINVASSLSGKVAGVNVSRTSTGPAGSTRIVIRGNSSISGNNQPLYVVDGVPIDNSNLGSAGMWGGQDWGDGIQSINPDDIETMSVLKGNTAAALYGFRAANGVILITTKSGKGKGKGIGIEFNSNFVGESVLDFRDFQTQFGHGANGLKPTTEADAIANGLISWGGRLDGSNVLQFDGVSRPYSDVGSNLDRFYRTGSTFTNTLSFTGGNEDFNFRASASNLDNKGIVPNSGLTRRNFTLKANARLGEKWNATMSGTYINENVQNRPRLSDSPGNANYTVWTLPASINVDNLKGDPNKLGADPATGEEFKFNDNNFVTNPWWAAEQFEANNTRNRLLGNFQLRYDILDDLYIQGRAGVDTWFDRRRNLTPYGTAYSPRGQLSEEQRTFQELNLELILGYNKQISENVSLNLIAGGNQLRNGIETLSAGGSNFNVPFLHTVRNLANQSPGYGISEFQVNSVFGQAEVGLFNALYITGTVRNDWFSTLTKATGDSDNSKLYGSAGVSLVLSDVVDLPDFISFAKVRGSWAEVGGATNPYQLSLNYAIFGQGHLGNPLGGINNGSVPNANLVPSTSTETEFGLDLRLLEGRLGVDFAYYNRSTINDILSATISSTSGYGSKSVNVGEITNKGVELLITATPVQTQDMRWDVSFNFANNQNEVAALLTPENDGEDVRVDESRTRNAYIHHVEGLPYSQIAGFGYARDASGNIQYDDNGYPQQGDFQFFGTGVHPTTMGLNNSVSYKNLTLSFLIDMQTGAKIYAATNRYGYSQGLHQNTLQGRDGGALLYGTTIASDQVDDYYGRIAGNITEEFVEDADFIKLRQVVLAYKLPAAIVNKLPVAGVSLSLTARNLALLWSKVDNIDPESTYSAGNAQGLEMFGVPQTRSYGVNLNVKF